MARDLGTEGLAKILEGAMHFQRTYREMTEVAHPKQRERMSSIDVALGEMRQRLASVAVFVDAWKLCEAAEAVIGCEQSVLHHHYPGEKKMSL